MLCDGPPGGRVEKRYKYSYLLSVGPDARMHKVHAHLYMYSAMHEDIAGCCHLLACSWAQLGIRGIAPIEKNLPAPSSPAERVTTRGDLSYLILWVTIIIIPRRTHVHHKTTAPPFPRNRDTPRSQDPVASRPTIGYSPHW